MGEVRQETVSHLGRRLRSVQSMRPGQALGLWGEAGIGKSWTLETLLTTTGCRTVFLRVDRPLSAQLSGLPRSARTSTWADPLIAAVAPGSRMQSGAVADVLSGVLPGLAPVILAVEDLHEADQDDLSALLLLAARLPKMKGVALLVTSRQPLPPPVDALRLEPLSADEIMTVLEGEVRTVLPASAVAWIHQRAAGNPLFTLEFFRFLARAGHLWSDGTWWHWRAPEPGRLPVSVEALIERQLRDAGGAQEPRRALEALSLLPPQTDRQTLAKVAGLTDQAWTRAMGSLEHSGLVRGGAFGHPLYREVRRSTLRPERVQALARRILEVYSDRPALAAPFIVAAGDDPATTLRRFMAAAADTGDALQRARLLAQAVPYADPPDQPDLALRAAEGLRHDDPEEAIRLARLALPTVSRRAEAGYLLARLLTQQQRAEEAERVFGALDVAAQTSPAGLETRIELLSLTGQHQAAVAAYDRLLSPDARISGQTVGRLVFSLSELALPGRAIALANSFLQTSSPEAWDTAVILNALGVLYNGTGQFRLAEATFSRIIGLLETTFGGRRVFVALSNRAIARKWTGHFQDAQADARRALTLAAEAGDALMTAAAHTLLGELAFEGGQYAEAEEHYLASCARLEHLDDSQHSAEAHGRLSELYLAWDLPRNRVLALKHAHLALEQVRSQGSPTFLTNGLFWAAQAEARFGQAERALGYAEEANVVAAQSPSLAHSQNALWARGAALLALGRSRPAQAAFKEAAAAARKLGHPVEVQKLGLELDALKADLSSARARIAWFEARGLIDGVKQAQRLFPELAPVARVLVQTAHTRLKVLGPLLLHGGQELAVRGAKCQDLLLLLLERRIVGAPEVPLLTLLETLYPGVAERPAEALLRQLVFQSRGRLGQDLIVTTPGGYALGGVGSDAEEFLGGGSTELWRGPYRANVAGEGDDTVAEALHRALAARLEPLVAQNPAEAARVGRLLLEAEPYNAEHLQLTLRALQASANHRSLARLYAVARARFLDVGERLPATWQEFVQPAPTP